MATDIVSVRSRNPNATLYLGSDNDSEARLFCFERGPHTLVIQAPELTLPGYTHPGVDPEADEQYISTFKSDLEKISSLVNGMVFGKTNWAYIVTEEDGSCHLDYKEKHIPPISCPAWAPLIPETDLVYSKYITAEDREAVWNGRVVDCLIGWNDRWRDFVECAMRGHRLLEGLDVTYEVLGHIVRNGEIIGLMTGVVHPINQEQPVDDRRVEYRDSEAVYAAVAKVQSRGLVISFNETSINIHRGKVRLPGTQTVRKFSEVNDPKATADIYHWQNLSRIFDELCQHSNSMPLLRCVQVEAVPFIPTPTPGKPLNMDLFRMIVTF